MKCFGRFKWLKAVQWVLKEFIITNKFDNPTTKFQTLPNNETTGTRNKRTARSQQFLHWDGLSGDRGINLQGPSIQPWRGSGD